MSVFRTKKNQNTKHIYKRVRVCMVTTLPRIKKKQNKLKLGFLFRLREVLHMELRFCNLHKLQVCFEKYYLNTDK